MTISSQKTKKRAPRFHRVSNINFRLQDRDVEIVRQVYKHRLLNSAHIRALVSGSDQVVLRRLQALYHNGFLDRPREQIQQYRSGSNPMVYGLGNRGAEILSRGFGIPRGKIDWTSKNRKVKSIFLEHTILVADFMVCLEVACRLAGNIRLIEPEEIISQAPRRTQNKKNPYGIKIETVEDIHGEQRRISIGLTPDKLFGLHFLDEPEGRNQAHFFLEADRSTMPIKRKNPYSRSFYKKILGYYVASPMQDSIFQSTFNFPSARVLTVTTSHDRIKTMISANKEVDQRHRGIGMFLFTTKDNLQLDDPARLLKKIWINGREEQASLLD